jgi:hypothetical protein
VNDNLDIGMPNKNEQLHHYRDRAHQLENTVKAQLSVHDHTGIVAADFNQTLSETRAITAEAMNLSNKRELTRTQRSLIATALKHINQVQLRTLGETLKKDKKLHALGEKLEHASGLMNKLREGCRLLFATAKKLADALVSVFSGKMNIEKKPATILINEESHLLSN